MQLDLMSMMDELKVRAINLAGAEVAHVQLDSEDPGLILG